MSYAIIETGGKQVRVEPGRFYDIELLPVEPEEKVSIERVLLVQHNGDVHIGQPLVTGATVEGTVLRHMRARKIIVYKMRPKKKTRKKQGHRQEITRLMINSISLNGSVLADEQAAQQGVPAGDTTPAAVSPAAETIATPAVADEPAPETAAPQETPENTAE